jgi:hypothetical protein
MRLGGEPVGRWGIALLAVTGIVGLLLAWHGWTGRSAAVTPSLAGKAASSGPARGTQGAPSSPSPAQPSPAQPSPAQPSSTPASPAASPAPTASAKAGPLLSSEPYASVTYQIWPGPLSAAATHALTGLNVAVHQRGPALLVTAGVIGQAPGSPHLYVGGARVYVVEAAPGDDSGNADYNLGDDDLVVTNAQGRIVR